MCRGRYGTLIALYPRESYALYLDSGSKEKQKNYALIKNVLDDALNGYVLNEGFMARPNIIRNKHVFKHRTEFPCVKQAPGGGMEAWYLIQHMNDYVKDQDRLQFQSSVEKWCFGISEWTDTQIRQGFGRIQNTIARTIHRDVLNSKGIFYRSIYPLPNEEIVECITAQGDVRPFNSLEGSLPFPPMPKKITKKSAKK